MLFVFVIPNNITISGHLNKFRWKTKRKNKNKGQERLWVIFIHFVKYNRDGECKRKSVKERKKRLSSHFIPFCSSLIAFGCYFKIQFM